MNDSRKIARRLNDNRAYLLFTLMLIMGITAKNFFTLFNITGILNSTQLYAFIGMGFTLCMIAGHMDLSVGMTTNLGAVLVMGMHTFSKLPWAIGITIALVGGALAGVINGVLVSKFKIHSFIATLGMQFVLKGMLYMYCGGAEIGDKGDFAFADFLNMQLKPLPLTPKIIFTLAVVLAFAYILSNTRWGRNIYMMGGNAETAWLAGINRDAYTIVIFMISGAFCALGGAIFAICQSSALPNLGEKGISPLMVALAATIIGGTQTTGGAGSVWKTFVAILGLMTMFNVLTSLVGKYEIQILSNGIVLALCVLYETLAEFSERKKIGVRGTLLEELKSRA